MLTIQEWGWAHNAAYNAMLQAGRALMFSKGYRFHIRNPRKESRRKGGNFCYQSTRDSILNEKNNLFTEMSEVLPES